MTTDTLRSFIEKSKSTIQNTIFYKLVPRGLKILDVGAGKGLNTRRMCDDGYNAYGIELSPEFLDLGYVENGDKETFVDSEGNPRLQIGSVLEMPYRNKEFDAAIAMGMLHSLGNKREAMKSLIEIRRVLKENGTLYGTAFSDGLKKIYSLPNGSNLAVVAANSREAGKPMTFDRKELEDSLLKAGFEYVGIREFGKGAFGQDFIFEFIAKNPGE